MADDAINHFLLSRTIPGVSFNFKAYVEPEIPGGGAVNPPPIPPNSRYIIKPKIFEGFRHTKNRAPKPLTHSHSHYI